MAEEEIAKLAPLIVVVNAAAVGLFLVLAGRFLAARKLTSGVPDARQNVGEFVLTFFVDRARQMSSGKDGGRIVRVAAPLLATFFLFIFVSNLMAVLPLPVIGRPPTSHYSVTLSLALCSVIGTLLVSGFVRGPAATLKHLVWPNPMQWISEFTDVLSLSLRLFGNIAGEYMTVVLVAAIVPYGIPLILHAVGLIPAFVQALVFTLLTASFMASAVHHEEGNARKRRSKAKEAGGEAAHAQSLERGVA